MALNPNCVIGVNGGHRIGFGGQYIATSNVFGEFPKYID